MRTLVFSILGALFVNSIALVVKSSATSKEKSAYLRSGEDLKSFGDTHDDDQTITKNVKSTLFREPRIESHRIVVSTKKRVVYLKGDLSSENDAIRANQVVRQVEGVRAVVNMLHINP